MRFIPHPSLWRHYGVAILEGKGNDAGIMSEESKNIRYAESHEWARLEEDGTITVGISAYAQENLGDVTFVELPEEGDSFGKGDSFGVVESVKAASDLYAPVGGEVVGRNDALEDRPDLVNEDPLGEGWIIRIKPEDASEWESLLSEADYQASNG